MYDTIIIGAGMSGLAAGIRLAHFDKKVCILERHYTIGGLNSFYRLHGRDFDVGLHAVTNYAPKGASRGPLAKILRQLRFKWEDFALAPQRGSRIAFPDVNLRFDNDLDLLRCEVQKAFPGEVDAFERLLREIADYDDLDHDLFVQSTRQRLADIFREPLLAEMLLCPVMWYGNARQEDMDWGQFSIIFRSIFLEGFGRPFKGVRLILKNLVKRFRTLGGELRLRHGVKRILTENNRACGVELDDGRVLQAKRILSSAGRLETLRLCDLCIQPDPRTAGQLSFFESISVIDCQPDRVGHDETIIFFNDRAQFDWRKPTDALCDVRSGVICVPNNYQYAGSDQLHEGYIRITSIADYQAWNRMSPDAYGRAKWEWYDRSLASAVRFVADFRHRVIATDVFTPQTIRKFTFHDNGAVYGAPDKQLDGTTPLENLYLCGTDQGFVGIIGAIMSGIAMANRHCLRAS
jgi:phytoene dehydrogenase-like protein